MASDDECSTVSINSYDQKQKQDVMADLNEKSNETTSQLMKKDEEDITFNNKFRGKRGQLLAQHIQRSKAEALEEAFLQTITKSRRREVTGKGSQKNGKIQKLCKGKSKNYQNNMSSTNKEHCQRQQSFHQSLQKDNIDIEMKSISKHELNINNQETSQFNNRKVGENQEKDNQQLKEVKNVDLLEKQDNQCKSEDDQRDIGQDIIWSADSLEEKDDYSEGNSPHTEQLDMMIFNYYRQEKFQLQIIADGNFNQGGVSLQIDFDKRIIKAVKQVKTADLFNREIKVLQEINKRSNGLSDDQVVAMKLLDIDQNNLVFSLRAGFISYRQVLKIVQLKHLQERYRQPFEFFILKQLFVLYKKLGIMNSQHKIAHSDIKPNNIVIGFDFVPFFIDFGGSIFIEQEADQYLSLCTLAFVKSKFTEQEDFDKQSIIECEQSSLMLTFLFMLCRNSDENKLFFKRKYSELIEILRQFYSPEFMDIFDRAIVQEDHSQIESNVKTILDRNLGEYISQSESILSFLKELKQFEFSPKENLYVIKEWDDFNQNILKLFPSMRFELDLMQVGDAKKLYEYFRDNSNKEIFVDTSRGFFVTLINSFLDYSENCHTVRLEHLIACETGSNERFRVGDVIKERDGYLTVRVNFRVFLEIEEENKREKESRKQGKIFQIQNDCTLPGTEQHQEEKTQKQSQQQQQQHKIHFSKMRKRMSALSVISREEPILWNVFAGLQLTTGVQELKVKCRDIDITEFQGFLIKQVHLKSFHMRVKENNQYKLTFPVLFENNQLSKLKTNLGIVNQKEILSEHTESLIDLEITVNAGQLCSPLLLKLSKFEYLNKISLIVTQINTPPGALPNQQNSKTQCQLMSATGFRHSSSILYRKKGNSAPYLCNDFYNFLIAIFSKTRVPIIKLNFSNCVLNIQDIHQLARCFKSAARDNNQSEQLMPDLLPSEIKSTNIPLPGSIQLQQHPDHMSRFQANQEQLEGYHTDRPARAYEPARTTYVCEPYDYYPQSQNSKLDQFTPLINNSQNMNNSIKHANSNQSQLFSSQTSLGPHTVKVNLKVLAKPLDDASTKIILTSLLQSHIPRIKVQINNIDLPETKELNSQSSIEKSQFSKRYLAGKKLRYPELSLFENSYGKIDWVKQISIHLSRYNLNTQQLITHLTSCDRFKLVLKGYNQGLLSQLEDLEFPRSCQELIVKPCSSELDYQFSMLNFTNDQVISVLKSKRASQSAQKKIRSLMQMSTSQCQEGNRLEDYIDFKSNKLFSMGTSTSNSNSITTFTGNSNLNNHSISYPSLRIAEKNDISIESDNRESDILGGLVECLKGNEQLTSLHVDFRQLSQLVKKYLLAELIDAIKYNKSVSSLTIEHERIPTERATKALVSCLSFNETLKEIYLGLENCQLPSDALQDIAQSLLYNDTLHTATFSLLRNPNLTSISQALLLLKDTPSNLNYTILLSNLNQYSSIFSVALSQYQNPQSLKSLVINLASKSDFKRMYKQYNSEDLTNNNLNSSNQISSTSKTHPQILSTTSSSQVPNSPHSSNSIHSRQRHLSHLSHFSAHRSIYNSSHQQLLLHRSNQNLISSNNSSSNNIFRLPNSNNKSQLFNNTISASAANDSPISVNHQYSVSSLLPFNSFEKTSNHSDEEDDDCNESIPLNVEATLKKKALWKTRKISNTPQANSAMPSMMGNEPESPQIQVQFRNTCSIRKKSAHCPTIIEPGLWCVIEKLNNQLKLTLENSQWIDSLSELLKTNQVLQELSLILSPSPASISLLSLLEDGLQGNIGLKSLGIEANFCLSRADSISLGSVIRNISSNICKIKLSLAGAKLNQGELRGIMIALQQQHQQLVDIELDLSSNNIQPHAARQIALFTSPHLENLSLNISDNFLNAEGLDAICEPLFQKSPQNLKSLTLILDGNTLGNSALALLACSLKSNKSLQKLTLSLHRNSMKAEFATYLRIIASKHPTIKEFSLAIDPPQPQCDLDLTGGDSPHNHLDEIELKDMQDELQCPWWD